MKVGLVVPKESAVLNYPNERATYLEADHRSICKFESPEDPNYLKFKNALAGRITIIREAANQCQTSAPLPRRKETANSNAQSLNVLLEVNDTSEDDLYRMDTVRMPKSCSWICEREAYKTWREGVQSRLYWTSANPGAGKTVLSSYVVSELKNEQRDCCFYFFSHEDKLKSTIAVFLRAMACQMASIHPNVSELLLKACKKDQQLAKMDHRTIWRKLYLEGILKQDYLRPQFWIIDGLDECKRDHELVPYIVTAAEKMRIFVTSRHSYDFYPYDTGRSTHVDSDTFPRDSTNSDIRLYLTANMNQLPAFDADGPGEQERIVQELVTKSDGCFLWAKLAFQELRKVTTAAEIRNVLDAVPSDMSELYLNVLRTMSEQGYGKDVAKAILTWVVCSVHPLTTAELRDAVQLDIRDMVTSIERWVENHSGHLIYVDKDARVHLIHQSARDFLLDPQNRERTEFAIDKTAGHKRLAEVCLRHLTKDNKQTNGIRQSTSWAEADDGPTLTKYACDYVWEHLIHVPSEDDGIFSALLKFVSSPSVLFFIDFVATRKDLNRLIQAGQTIKNFVQRRAQHIVPLGKEIAILESWAVDLSRLATKFGRQLSLTPWAIHQLIPPFCPTQSALRKQFATSGQTLQVHGLSNSEWDDCAVTLAFSESVPSAVATSERCICVGFLDGILRIYDETTCQELRVVQDGGGIKLLRFGETGNFLAVAGTNFVSLWAVESWTRMWTKQLPAKCLCIAFVDNDQYLLGTIQSNQLLEWHVGTGEATTLPSWVDHFDDETARTCRRPQSSTMAPNQNLLAVVYRGQDIILWDYEQNQISETYGQKEGALKSNSQQSVQRHGRSTPQSVIFSVIGVLAASFNDGELVLFDLQRGCVQARGLANAHCLTAASNGLTLACGNSSGTIQLIDFDSRGNLRLLYRVRSEEYAIKSLAFTHDGRRLVDIRGPYMRVWDPSILARQTLDDGKSDTVSVSTVVEDYQMDESPVNHISAMTCADDAIFCGKIDGSVDLYDASTGLKSHTLWNHAPGAAVIALFFDAEGQVLGSADSSSRAMVFQLTRNTDSYQRASRIFDHSIGKAIEQFLLGGKGTRLLVSTDLEHSLWPLNILDTPNPTNVTRSRVPVTSLTRQEHQGHWITHPSDSAVLALFEGNAVLFYQWSTLSSLPMKAVQLLGSIPETLTIQSAVPCFGGTVIATSFAETHQTTTSEKSQPRSSSNGRLLFWKRTELMPTMDELNAGGFGKEAAPMMAASPIPYYQPIADQVETLIGTCGPKASRAVFLKEDGWVCSADSTPAAEGNVDIYKSEGLNQHLSVPFSQSSRHRRRSSAPSVDGTAVLERHFFFPSEWLVNSSTHRGQSQRMIQVLRNGKVVLVVKDEVAIVSRGLDQFEMASMNGGKGRSSSRVAAREPSMSRSQMSDMTLSTLNDFSFK